MTYAYDDADQLTSVTDWDSNVTGYAYDDAGRMTTATLPSGTGIVSTYAYDDADRLTSISHVKGGLTTVASVSYTLDNVGNRTQRVVPSVKAPPMDVFGATTTLSLLGLVSVSHGSRSTL